MDVKITEQAAAAHKQFMEKANKIIAQLRGEKQVADLAQLCASEYTKIYGRFGSQPLLAVKGGRQPPRYMLDRDEVWLIYKPPLWQCGGGERNWKGNVMELVSNNRSLVEAQQKMMNARQPILQEYHGLTLGLKWLQEEDERDGTRKCPSDWGFIQRLDLETDGPVIAAKTWRAQQFLKVQLKEHIFSKAYICLVHGKVENRIQSVVAKFAQLAGVDPTDKTQIMLKHDVANDPFYNVTRQGLWKNRRIKEAVTLLKPMAYYKKKDDQSDYTLVYVNILTGITHQIRITMQSLGHPLVSDDRYLPRNQALADCQWCPRNFLCEVRSDWFDMCGPFPYPERRRYARISVQNPLPKLFQDILEKKLVLVQKLDPKCDLYQGCQYWALGDEQLMADHPKDAEYRKKVMRWGIRHGIFLDALDRLLLLSREEIDRVMSQYQPPHEDEANWVCPLCMEYNFPTPMNDGSRCRGWGPCPGQRKMPPRTKISEGWRNYLGDPTIHMLMLLNRRLLEARKEAVRKPRPSWDRAPNEDEGSQGTPEIIVKLHEALVDDAKTGGFGLDQEYLQKIPGLEEVKLPLQLPSDCEVLRVRLPGRGLGSRWRYTLTGKERLKVAGNFSAKLFTSYREPILVDTDKLPKKQTLSQFEDTQLQAQQEKVMREAPQPVTGSFKSSRDWDREEREEPEAKREAKRRKTWKRVESKSGAVLYVDPESGIRESLEARNSKARHAGDVPAPSTPPGLAAEGIAWQRVESKSNPGRYYYFNPKTGTNEITPPVVQKPWKLLESKSSPGHWYYFNESSGESSEVPPPCARPASTAPAPPVQLPIALESPWPAPTRAPVVSRERTDDLPEGWEKHRSSQHGKFYYINTKTDETQWTRPQPVRAGDEWRKRESTKFPGKFYFQNVKTGETKWQMK